MGGIPGGLGPGKPAGPGGLITGVPGDPSWLSVPASEDAPLFAVPSLDKSSLVVTGSAAAGEKPGTSLEGSNPVGMNGVPPGGMEVGDITMWLGKTGRPAVGTACGTTGT